MNTESFITAAREKGYRVELDGETTGHVELKGTPLTAVMALDSAYATMVLIGVAIVKDEIRV